MSNQSKIQNEQMSVYVNNLCALLIILTVVGNFVDLCAEGSGISQSLFLFIYSFHMPLLIFLAGSLSRDAVGDRKRILRGAAVMFSLYVSLKAVIWLTRLVMGETPKFSLLSESSTPWLFFSLGLYLLFAYLARNVNKRFLLALSVIFALLCGYNTSIGDYLTASRTLVFLPFFQIGQMCDMEEVSRRTAGRSKRVAGLAVLVLALLAMVVFRKHLYVLRPMFTGRNAYTSLGKGAQVKWAYRLAAYAVSVTMSWAMLAVAPRAALGRWISRIGERFLFVYFWYRPVLYLFANFDILERLIRKTGWRLGHFMWICLAFMLSWALSSFEIRKPKHPDQWKRWDYLRAYSACFTVTFFCVYGFFIFSGRSFVWSADGRTQMFPTMVYIGRSIRNLIKGCMEGNFSVPLFDLNIGLGEDIISFTNSIGMNDPLIVALSPLFTERYAEYLYGFLSFFYLFLAGLSFSYLCFMKKREPLHVLTGAMVYCFSGWVCIRQVRSFSFFTMGMIQMPLLAAGAYKILRGERPYLFIMSVCWSAINKYYSLYMMAIAIAIYVTIHYFTDISNGESINFHDFKMFIRVCGKLFLYSLLGICLAGIAICPAAAGFLESSRSHGLVLEQIYDWEWYRDNLLRLFARPGEEYLDIAAIAFFAVITMFVSRRKYLSLKIITLITIWAYFSSLAGFVMNGFQYPSHRWIFIVALVFAMGVVEMMPELLHMRKYIFTMCFLAVCVYTAFILWHTLNGVGSYSLIGVVFMTITLLVIGGAVIWNRDGTAVDAERQNLIFSIAILVVVICNVTVNGAVLFAPKQDNLINEFQAFGLEGKRLRSATERYLEPYYSSFAEGRADGTNFYRNTGMVWEIPSALASFNSVENKHIIDFWNSIELSTRKQVYNHYSTDHRTIPLTLLSSKYYVEKTSLGTDIPYGYHKESAASDYYDIYVNDYALPWGYTYDQKISYDTLDRLEATSRQQAMLQAIAIDDADADCVADLQIDDQQIPYQLSYSGCSWENGVLKVTAANASITVTFDAREDMEFYIHLIGFSSLDSRKTDVKVSCNGQTDSTVIPGKGDNRYMNISNYLYNLGSAATGETEAILTFSAKGEWKLDAIEVVGQSFEHYQQWVEARRAEALENVVFSANCISGTIDLSSDKILCMSVPYSKGWSATVDGVDAEIMRGNYMFMALPLSAGHHVIEFSYFSPGLKAGILLTIAAATILIIMLLVDKKVLYISFKGRS